jgi:hypothetical protein
MEIMNTRAWWMVACAGTLVFILKPAPAGCEPSGKVPALPQTVTVLRRPLALKATASSPTEEVVAEYIPAVETLDRWTLMLGVRVFRGKISPEQAARMKGVEVQARRAQGDVMANSASFSRGGVHVIDFVMSSLPTLVEHNVMSFSKLKDGRLVSYQLARRYYQRDPDAGVEDGLRAFMQEIPTRREAYFAEIERLAGELLKSL